MAQLTLKSLDSSAALLKPLSKAQDGRYAFIVWGEKSAVFPRCIHFGLEESHAHFTEIDPLHPQDWGGLVDGIFRSHNPSLVVVLCRADLWRRGENGPAGKKGGRDWWRRLFTLHPSADEQRVVNLRRLLFENARISASIREAVGARAVVIEAIYDQASMQVLWDLSRETPKEQGAHRVHE